MFNNLKEKKALENSNETKQQLGIYVRNLTISKEYFEMNDRDFSTITSGVALTDVEWE